MQHNPSEFWARQNYVAIVKAAGPEDVIDEGVRVVDLSSLPDLSSVCRFEAQL